MLEVTRNQATKQFIFLTPQDMRSGTATSLALSFALIDGKIVVYSTERSHHKIVVYSIEWSHCKIVVYSIERSHHQAWPLLVKWNPQWESSPLYRPMFFKSVPHFHVNKPVSGTGPLVECWAWCVVDAGLTQVFFSPRAGCLSVLTVGQFCTIACINIWCTLKIQSIGSHTIVWTYGNSISRGEP